MVIVNARPCGQLSDDPLLNLKCVQACLTFAAACVTFDVFDPHACRMRGGAIKNVELIRIGEMRRRSHRLVSAVGRDRAAAKPRCRRGLHIEQ